MKIVAVVTYKMFLLMFLTFLTIQQLNGCEERTDHRNYHLLDLGSTCGHGSLNKYESRIVGGVPAGFGALPWMVYILITKGQPDGTVVSNECGGTLINNRYVLTATHCYQFNGDKPRTMVYLGMYKLSKKGGDCEDGKCHPPVTKVEVADTILHPSFDSLQLHNDIALLRLVKPVEFSEYIKPICLPLSCNVRNTDYTGALMSVAGWGHTSPLPEGKAANTLRSLEVVVISEQRCRASWGDAKLISDSLICAGGQVGSSACSGDSGGPLMTQYHHDGDLQYVQIGIVSQGTCADSEDIRHDKVAIIRNKPGIYTKVAYFILWILDNIRE